ncbi:MAG: hypothetical protein ABFC94_09775 [Syntrophomonas sp.]
MNSKTINREAGDKEKGPRLQKMRAALLLLNALSENDQAHIYCAIEYVGDIYISRTSKNDSSDYLEENKNYNEERTFTLNSHEVLNSLVYFLDFWIEKYMSNNVHFGFYTNINYGKENNTDLIKKSGFKLPKCPLLKILMDKQHQTFLPLITFLIINEYEKQYADKPGMGYLETIRKFDNNVWDSFLISIEWNFGEPDEQQLQDIIIKKIRSSKDFDVSLEGKENYILRSLLDLLDERQTYSDPTKRFIHASEVRVLFLDLKTGELPLIDPVFLEWDKLKKEQNDKRILKEKLLSVCSEYSEMKIGFLSRRAMTATIELGGISDQRIASAYRYRIYEACSEKLFELLEEVELPLSQKALDNIIDNLYSTAKAHLEDKSKDYSYVLSNNHLIRNTILEIIDSCFLSFDKL